MANNHVKTLLIINVVYIKPQIKCYEGYTQYIMWKMKTTKFKLLTREQESESLIH